MQEYTSTSVDSYFWIVYFLLQTFWRLKSKISVYQDKIQSKIWFSKDWFRSSIIHKIYLNAWLNLDCVWHHDTLLNSKYKQSKSDTVGGITKLFTESTVQQKKINLYSKPAYNSKLNKIQKGWWSGDSFIYWISLNSASIIK